MVPGDFNNDGVDDVVLVGSGRYSLVPLISTFAGTFRQIPPPSVSGGQNGAVWVAAADFTGDGNLDLFLNRLRFGGMLLAGQGDGSFVLLSRPRTSGQRIREAAGVDLDGDGLAELVLTVGDRLTVLTYQNLGEGEFGFSTTTFPPVGLGPTRLGDFDRDGLADMAIIGFFADTRRFPASRPDTVVLMRGDGSGSFTPFEEAGYLAGQGPANLAIDDFNADGKLDVVVVSRRSFDVHLFVGDGLGGLERRSTGVIPFEPVNVDSADLTGNGAPDVVVSSVNSEEIAIFANDGSGTIEMTKLIERPLDGAIRLQPITRLALGRYQDGGGPVDLLDYRLSGTPLPGLGNEFESVVGELRMLASTCPIELSLDTQPDPVTAGRAVSLSISAKNVSLSTTMAGLGVSVKPTSNIAPTRVDASSTDACELRSPEVNASLRCDVGTLAPGDSFEASVHGTVPSSLASQFESRSDVGASHLGRFDHDSRTRTVYGSDVRAALQLDPVAVVFGQSLRLTATINNVGTESAVETAFEVELDDALRFVTAPDCVHSGELVGGIVTCRGEALDPLQQFARTIDVQVIPDPAPRPRALTVGAVMTTVAPSIDNDTFARDNIAAASVPVALAGIQPLNYGFESDRLVDWVVSAPGSAVSVQQFTRRSGRHALLIVGDASVWQDISGLEPGQTYSVSAWALAGNVNAPAEARLEIHDRLGGRRAIDGPRLVGGEWQRMQGLLDASARGTLRIELAGGSTAASGVLWDDVEIRVVNPRVTAVPDEQTTIQEAINAAADGDRIIVSPGIYRENIDFLGRAISLESRDGPERTIIDGGGNGPCVVFQSGEPSAAKLTGFHIRNGINGVDVLNGSPNIRANRIWDNMGRSSGVGVRIETGSPVIVENSIDGNETGGISGRFSSFSVRDNQVINNGRIGISGVGGKILIEGNVIDGHSIGITVSGDEVVVRNNVILNSGDARATSGFNVRAQTAIFEQNLAAVGAGEIRSDSGKLRFNFNTIVASPNERGASLKISGVETEIRNNIIVAGPEQVVFDCGGQPVTFGRNLIFHTATEPLVQCPPDAGKELVTGDPMFVSPDSGNYRLKRESPAIDAGTAGPAPSTDLDGLPRGVDGTGDGAAIVDMGAYEFVRWRPRPRSRAN